MILGKLFINLAILSVYDEYAELPEEVLLVLVARTLLHVLIADFVVVESLQAKHHASEVSTGEETICSLLVLFQSLMAQPDLLQIPLQTLIVHLEGVLALPTLVETVSSIFKEFDLTKHLGSFFQLLKYIFVAGNYKLLPVTVFGDLIFFYFKEIRRDIVTLLKVMQLFLPFLLLHDGPDLHTDVFHAFKSRITLKSQLILFVHVKSKPFFLPTIPSILKHLFLVELNIILDSLDSGGVIDVFLH